MSCKYSFPYFLQNHFLILYYAEQSESSLSHSQTVVFPKQFIYVRFTSYFSFKLYQTGLILSIIIKPGQPPLLVQLTGFLKSYLIKFYQLLNRTLIIQPFLKLFSLDHDPIPITKDPFRPIVILNHLPQFLISNMEMHRSRFDRQQISLLKCNA